MTISEFLEKAVETLEKEGVRYALAGGVAVSTYRAQPRTTGDLDFLILAESQTEKVAERIIRSFDLTPQLARRADLEGGPMFAIKKKNTPPCILVGRKTGDRDALGLDFILPAMPWFERAMARAQNNRIDFGVAKIPTLTVEDMIIAKFYSAGNDSKRFDDLSDLRAMFQANENLDLAYIVSQMHDLSIRVPAPILDDVPDILRKASKMVRRKQPKP